MLSASGQLRTTIYVLLLASSFGQELFRAFERDYCHGRFDNCRKVDSKNLRECQRFRVERVEIVPKIYRLSEETRRENTRINENQSECSVIRRSDGRSNERREALRQFHNKDISSYSDDREQGQTLQQLNELDNNKRERLERHEDKKGIERRLEYNRLDAPVAEHDLSLRLLNNHGSRGLMVQRDINRRLDDTRHLSHIDNAKNRFNKRETYTDTRRSLYVAIESQQPERLGQRQREAIMSLENDQVFRRERETKQRRYENKSKSKSALSSQNLSRLDNRSSQRDVSKQIENIREGRYKDLRLNNRNVQREVSTYFATRKSSLTQKEERLSQRKNRMTKEALRQHVGDNSRVNIIRSSTIAPVYQFTTEKNSQWEPETKQCCNENNLKRAERSKASRRFDSRKIHRVVNRFSESNREERYKTLRQIYDKTLRQIDDRSVQREVSKCEIERLYLNEKDRSHQLEHADATRRIQKRMVQLYDDRRAKDSTKDRQDNFSQLNARKINREFGTHKKLDDTLRSSQEQRDSLMNLHERQEKKFEDSHIYKRINEHEAVRDSVRRLKGSRVRKSIVRHNENNGEYKQQRINNRQSQTVSSRRSENIRELIHKDKRFAQREQELFYRRNENKQDVEDENKRERAERQEILIRINGFENRIKSSRRLEYTRESVARLSQRAGESTTRRDLNNRAHEERGKTLQQGGQRNIIVEKEHTFVFKQRNYDNVDHRHIHLISDNYTKKPAIFHSYIVLAQGVILAYVIIKTFNRNKDLKYQLPLKLSDAVEVMRF